MDTISLIILRNIFHLIYFFNFNLSFLHLFLQEEEGLTINSKNINV